MVVKGLLSKYGLMGFPDMIMFIVKVLFKLLLLEFSIGFVWLKKGILILMIWISC